MGILKIGELAREAKVNIQTLRRMKIFLSAWLKRVKK